jgi:hypothetical protein
MLAMAAEQQREKGRSQEGGEPTGRHRVVDDEAPGGIGEGSAADDYVYPLSTVLTTEKKNSNGVGPTYFCSGALSSVQFR